MKKLAGKKKGLVALLLVLLVLPQSAAAQTFALASGSQVSYKIKGFMHTAEATAPVRDEGYRILWSPTAASDFSSFVGQPLIVRWNLLDSGNRKRDSAVLEIVGAALFPEIKLVPRRISVAPSAESCRSSGRFVADLEGHGITQVVEGTGPDDFCAAPQGHIAADFERAVTPFGITPPKSLGVSAEDRFRVHVELLLSSVP